MITILTLNRYKNTKRTIFYLLKFFFIFFKRKLFLDIGSFFIEIKYTGHPQVVKSFVDGLNKLNIKYNLNPSKKKFFYSNVLVLSGIEQLEYAIFLKKNKRIKKIFAGPNIAIFPSEFKSIFQRTEIDYIVTPSKWVSDYYKRDLPVIKNKLKELPSGIDLDYWKPKLNKKKYVLFYVKEHNINFKFKINQYKKFLKSNSIKYKVLKYGSYNNRAYKKKLDQSTISIFFSISESQGFALFESWSMGVPTLVYYNKEITVQNKKLKSETAPYLTKSTGMYFKNFEEFVKNFEYIQNNYDKFDTRLWVKDNMTDYKCSEKILDFCNGVKN